MAVGCDPDPLRLVGGLDGGYVGQQNRSVRAGLENRFAYIGKGLKPRI